MFKKTFVQLSTDQQHLVLISKVNNFLINGSSVFETFLLDEQGLTETDKVYLRAILKVHPKNAAQLVAVSKTWGRSDTTGKFYEHASSSLASVCMSLQRQRMEMISFAGKSLSSTLMGLSIFMLNSCASQKTATVLWVLQ
jgi:hypothetical protein